MEQRLEPPENEMQPLNYIEYLLDGAVAVVTMAKPPHNLLDDDLLQQLKAAYGRAIEEKARALILRSSMRHFCAGLLQLSWPRRSTPSQTGGNDHDPSHDRDVAPLTPHRHGQGARGGATAARLSQPQLRRAPGDAGRSRGRRTRQCRARPTSAPCQVAPGRLPRGCRLPHSARSRPQPDPQPRQWPLAERAQQCSDPGPDR